MKKLLAILLALTMVLTFAACGKNTSDDKEEKKNKKEETVGNNDVSSDDEKMGVAALSDEEIAEKYTELELLGVENEELVAELYSAMSEFEGFENGYTDEAMAEAKTVFVKVFSKYASAEDAEIYAEMYCAMMITQVLMNQNPGLMDEIFESAEAKGYDVESEEFWNYVKEQLSEYVPEWCIEPVVMPIFSAVTINSRTKTCVANQREIRSQFNNFIICEAYDRVMDQEVEFYYYYGDPAYSLMGEGFVAAEIEDMFVQMPCCPADGVVIAKVYNDGNGNYSIDVYCRDNCDGANHS